MRSSFLQRFAVHPSKQRKGIGSLMLSHILEKMASNRMLSIKLNTQTENMIAKKLYENKRFSLSENKLSIMTSDLRIDE